MSQVNRNDPCPCGSGKKYKKCCGDTQIDYSHVDYQRWRQVEGDFTRLFYKFMEKNTHPDMLETAWHEFDAGGHMPENPDHPCYDLFERWSFYDWKISDNKASNDFDGMTIARATLSQTKDYMTKDQQRICDAIEQSPFSYYLVLKVVPNVCMHLRDLLRQKEIVIYDIKGSQEAIFGLVLYGRVVTIDDMSFFMGFGNRPLPGTYTNYIVELRTELEKKFKCKSLGSKELLLCEEDLRYSYFDFYESLDQPKKLTNTDGDPYEIHTMHYQISSAGEAFEALKYWEQKILEKTDEEILEEADVDKERQIVRVNLNWVKKGNKSNPDWDNTIMGNLAIDGTTLKVEVNSAKRAKRIQKEIQKRLGEKAVLLKIEKETAEGLQKRIQERPKQKNQEDLNQEELMQMPDVQEQIKEMAKKHWDSWFDIPVPALNNMTPREAAKDNKGKDMLDALLLDYERQAKNSTNNIFNPDIKFLKKELGLKNK